MLAEPGPKLGAALQRVDSCPEMAVAVELEEMAAPPSSPARGCPRVPRAVAGKVAASCSEARRVTRA